jgi:hypothetical protein
MVRKKVQKVSGAMLGACICQGEHEKVQGIG